MFGVGSSASSAGGLFGSTMPAFGSSTPAFGGGLSTPAFGASASAFGAPSAFGAASTPAFGSSTPAFGALTPAFGASTPAFGQSTPGFGSSTPAFGTSPSLAFGASSTPAFGSSTPAFGATPGSGASSAPLGGGLFSAGTAQPSSSLFGSSAGLLGTPSQSLFGQPQSQPSLLGQPQPASSASWQPGLFTNPQQQQQQLQQPLLQMFAPFGGQQQQQLMTQMAPVAPLGVPLPDREIQAVVDAYNDSPLNPRYRFRHLFLSVTDPVYRQKPGAITDAMWAEAMNKLESMDPTDRDRLWPELGQGFKDLSRRLKLQDEAIEEDTNRLRITENNVKQLQRHFEVDTMPWIQRLRQKEQELQRRLLHVMRIVEAFEVRGVRVPLSKGEVHLAERLRALARQMQGPSAEMPRRADALVSLSRLRSGMGTSASAMLPAAANVDESSLAEMHELLRKQTDAIERITGVLKRDMRDVEIMLEDADIRWEAPAGGPAVNGHSFRGRANGHSYGSGSGSRGAGRLSAHFY
ncbi:hypothetical protein CBR_g21943 [Chara braunii]|uniref:Nucleoporin Nup54 alpha-helical domain-containing protein n=1 Tax=Chara braunii TaxID=69332 RepID=A0A388L1I9_CHABU|nr:hypothetical protein CBR_g21943 [Chara braunii]|eukprot:GBG76194.1 hypothetical protein CBR_g21943 [Chara braunii]